MRLREHTLNKEDAVKALNYVIQTLNNQSDSTVRSRDPDLYGTIRLDVTHPMVIDQKSILFVVTFTQRSTGTETVIFKMKFLCNKDENDHEFYLVVLENLISYMHRGLEEHVIFKRISIKSRNE